MEEREPWPQDKQELEADLREALADLAGKPAAEAREAVVQLGKSHGDRRGWPWTKFGWSPLAQGVLAGRYQDAAILAPEPEVLDALRELRKDGVRLGLLSSVCICREPRPP